MSEAAGQVEAKANERPRGRRAYIAVSGLVGEACVVIAAWSWHWTVGVLVFGLMCLAGCLLASIAEQRDARKVEAR